MLQTLLWPDEVREPRLESLDGDVTVRPQELAMAESYINALSGDFDPSEFSDHYREALEEVIEAKAAGHELTAPAEEPRSTGQVVDLMDALRRSVAEAKERRGEGGSSKPEKAAAEGAGEEVRQQGRRQEGREDPRQEGHGQEVRYDEEGGGQEDRHPSLRLGSHRRSGHAGIPGSAGVLC